MLDINLSGEMVYPLADVLTERGVPGRVRDRVRRFGNPGSYARVARCEKPVDTARIAAALFP